MQRRFGVARKIFTIARNADTAHLKGGPNGHNEF